MSKSYVYICIVLMALVTYVIRMLPLVAFRKKITNKFLKSFLFYAPYVTLTSLTFPSIFYCTGSLISAVVGTIVALISAFISGNLPITAAFSCIAVFLVDIL